MQFPKKIPIIQLGRYMLRKQKNSDAEDILNILTDKEVIQNTSFDIRNIEQVRESWRQKQKQFKKSQRIGWIIEDVETGDFVGEISVFNIQTEHNKGEIGYHLSKKYWRRGIMSQVLQAIIDYLFDELKMSRIEAVVILITETVYSIFPKKLAIFL